MLNFYVLAMLFLCCIGIGSNLAQNKSIEALSGILLLPVFARALGYL